MQLLITGGAGFIGSHLADRLLESGHRVRVLDSLDPQVHAGGERPAYLDPEIELVVADVRDHDAVAAALDGVQRVVHFAAAVGVGQSMYEIERYTSVNSLGCAVLLEEVVKKRDAIDKVLVASSMSIYGEGQHRNPATGEERARARAPPRAAARAPRVGRARRRRDAARARADGRDEAAAADLRLRRRQAGPRGADARRRRRLRDPVRRAPLLQRLRRAGSRSAIRTRAWPRSSPPG